MLLTTPSKRFRKVWYPKSIIDQYNIKLIIQEDITGTGTAVKIALENLEDLSDQDIVLIQYGDTPLYLVIQLWKWLIV